MVVTINVLDDDLQKYTIEINNPATFDDIVLALLEKNVEVPNEAIILKNSSKMELDKNYTFSNNESIILRNRANLEGYTINFNDVTNKRIQQLKVTKTKNGCGYRYVAPGINLYGVCECKDCKAFNKEVIEMIKDNELDLTQQKGMMHCPICKSMINCTTVGFYKCYYNIYGMKYNEDTDENEKFGKKIDNFSSIYVNTDDTVLVNGVKYKVDKTNGEMLSKFDQSNGNATFIKLIFQVKKY
jgi:hypothetical protein